MISPDQENRREEYLKYQRSKQIAIYGYYSRGRKHILEKLRDYLGTKDLIAKLPSDIEIQNSRIPPYEYDEEAELTSEMLYDTSDIHIFILIPPTTSNRTFLDSVSMEYGWARKDRQKYVGVFYQKGYDFATLPKGAQMLSGTWTLKDFEEIEEIFDLSTKYCEYAIRTMWIQNQRLDRYYTGYHY